MNSQDRAVTYICKLKVWRQSFLHSFLHEDSPFWNLPQKEPHQDSPFIALNPETKGRCGCLPSSLQEAFFSISVLQLNCPNFAQVEQVSAELQLKELSAFS